MRLIPLVNLSEPVSSLGELRRSLSAYYRGTEVLAPSVALKYTEMATGLELVISAGRKFNEEARAFNAKHARSPSEPEAHDAPTGPREPSSQRALEQKV